MPELRDSCGPPIYGWGRESELHGIPIRAPAAEAMGHVFAHTRHAHPAGSPLSANQITGPAV
jgi:hypothetical protein